MTLQPVTHHLVGHFRRTHEGGHFLQGEMFTCGVQSRHCHCVSSTTRRSHSWDLLHVMKTRLLASLTILSRVRVGHQSEFFLQQMNVLLLQGKGQLQLLCRIDPAHNTPVLWNPEERGNTLSNDLSLGVASMFLNSVATILCLLIRFSS